MKRRTAMAVSVSTVITSALGFLAFATLSGMDLLGFAPVESPATNLIALPLDNDEPTTSVSQPTVVATTVVSATPTATIVVVPGPLVGGNPPAGNTPRIVVTVPAGTTAPPSPVGTGPATTAPPTTPTTVVPVPPTAAPLPATTLPTPPAPSTTSAAPTSTLPAGVKIPSDWPPDKPIPAIPAGCRSPQLEDNGVWNCQH